ncbi:aldo/keto reductase [Streptomyces sp. NPDC056653]|uniref:aldo/keto reductase n=1 Tax=Streptomyces sp. NPDC056653 TaxID=3345894 RepID=UPI0036B95EA0
MKTLRLGTAGPEVSAVGLGCMAMSGLYGPADDAESLATIRRAMEVGITLLDTADVYGSGRNEELIGRAVRGHRDEAVIATKFGFVRDRDGRRSGERNVDGRPEYVRAACEASLHRLGVETIDLYQQHRVDPLVPIEETVGAMAELVAEGKVRYLGLSEAQPADLRRAHAVHPIASLQSEYSLLERAVEDDVLGVCVEAGIGFLAYAPLVRGLLADTLPPPGTADGSDTRAGGRFPRLDAEHRTANSTLVSVVRDIARSHGATPGRVALAWLLSREQPVVPIPGTRRIAYVEDNAQAPDLHLSDDERARLDTLAQHVHGDRYGGDAKAGTRVSPTQA